MNSEAARHTARTDGRDASRRHVLGLGAWSAAVALFGSVAARKRALAAPASARAASTRPAPRRAAAPQAQPATDPVVPQPGPTSTSTVVAAPADPAASDLASAGLTGEALILHVARRTTFGPTPALLDEIRLAGVDTWLDRQLQPGDIADAEVEQRLARLHDLALAPQQFRSCDRMGEDVLADLQVAALVRAVQSNRHLQEVMVDLWHDQLAASSAKAPVEWYLPAYDRDVIRPHALGRYADLLRAATKAGAMLEYLDTAGSAAPNVNENHGRELLELHTVGRAAGFGQGDVAGAARVLSGWTLDAAQLTVTFDPARHDASPATVVGWTTPGRSGPGAGADLDSLLEHLATHPATANRIATVLLERFVADDPPADLVASTAGAYLSSGTDLAATLRHIFASDAFRTPTPIVRRPFDLFAAQLRATAAALTVPNLPERLVPSVNELLPLDGVTNLVDQIAGGLVDGALDQRPIAVTVRQVLRRNGQLLFAAPNPSGHPVAGSRWSFGDALLRRWSLAAAVAHDQLPGITIDPAALAGGGTRAGDVVDALAIRCFAYPASAATRAATLTAMDRTEGDPIDAPLRLRQALAFLLAAPEMQVR